MTSTEMFHASSWLAGVVGGVHDRLGRGSRWLRLRGLGKPDRDLHGTAGNKRSEQEKVLEQKKQEMKERSKHPIQRKGEGPEDEGPERVLAHPAITPVFDCSPGLEDRRRVVLDGKKEIGS